MAAREDESFTAEWFWPAVGMGAAVTVLQLLIPAFSVQIFDRVPASGSLETLAALLTAAAVAVVGVAALEIMRARWIANVGGARSATLGGRALAEAAAQPGDPARDIEAQERDAAALLNFFSAGAPAKAIDFVFAAAPLLALYAMHPVAGIAVSLAALGAGVCARAASILRARPPQAPTPRRDRWALDRANGDADRLRAETSKRTARDWRRRIDAETGAESVSAVDRAIRAAAPVGLIGFGAAMASTGGMTPGEAIAMSILGARVIGSVANGFVAIDGWWAARAAFDRLIASIDRATPDAPTTPAEQEGLRVDRLTVAIGGRVALRDLSLSLQPGAFAAIAGDPGAGKSTLVAACAGAADTAMGLVRIGGAAASDAARAGWIGYIDERAAQPDGTIRAALGGRTDAEAYDGLERFNVIEAVAAAPGGLDAPMAALPSNARVLVRLARAFAAPRRIILLDEPEIWLGADHIALLETACRAQAAAAATVLWATKRPATLAAADQAFALVDGRLRPLRTPGAPQLTAVE